MGGQGQISGVNTLRKVIGTAGCMHRVFFIPFPTSAASKRQQTELTQVIESLLLKVGRQGP